MNSKPNNRNVSEYERNRTRNNLEPRFNCRFCILIGVAVFIFGCIIPFVSADVGCDHPLAVFISYPAGSYYQDSQITVTVDVFDSGNHSDPVSVSLVVRQAYTTRKIELTRIETGQYQSVITILEDDIISDNLNLECYVADGESPILYANDMVSIPVLREFIVEITIPDPDDQLPNPGQDVEFQVETKYQGIPIVPDQDTLIITLFTKDEEINLPFQMTQIGHFVGTYTVPLQKDQSEEYRIEAYAEYTPVDITFSNNDITLFTLKFYEVWINTIGVTTSSTVLDLYVLDNNGNPISDAEVSLEYSYFDSFSDYITSNLQTSTDGEGWATFTLSYLDLGEQESLISCSGYIEKMDYIQFFDIIFEARQEDFQFEEGFYVIFNNQLPLPYNTNVLLESIATYDGTPIVQQQIIYYISFQEHAISYGTIQTGSSGDFSIQIQTPMDDLESWKPYSPYLWLYFQIEIDDEWFTTDRILALGEDLSVLNAHMDPQTSITVPNFHLGEEIECAIHDTRADGLEEYAYILCGIGHPLDIEAIHNPEWTYCSRFNWNYGPIRRIECSWSENAWRGTIVIPTIFEEDTIFYFYGVITFNMLDRWDIHVASIQNVNPLPIEAGCSFEIIKPTNQEIMNGSYIFQGIAKNIDNIQSLEIRFDAGKWIDINRTTRWFFEIDSKDMSYGIHRFEIRSGDGHSHLNGLYVDFIVDQVPEIQITLKDDKYINGIFIFQGQSIDDHTIISTEYRIDNNAWSFTNGSKNWTCSIDTSTLSSERHKIQFRTYDGIQYSALVLKQFIIDQAPVIKLENFSDQWQYTDTILVSGKISDDGDNVSIEVRLDNGDWIVISNGTSWTYKIASDNLSGGEHVLEFRAYDGVNYSDVFYANFTLIKSSGVDNIHSNVEILIILVFIIVISMFVIFYYIYQRNSKKNDGGGV